MIFAGTMNLVDSATVDRLEGYFGRLGKILGNDERRASFATYARRGRARLPSARMPSTNACCIF